MKRDRKITVETVQKTREEQKVEFANEQRQDINFSSEQVAGYPFNAQLLYPEYEALDTVEKKENLIDKLTE